MSATDLPTDGTAEAPRSPDANDENNSDPLSNPAEDSNKTNPTVVVTSSDTPDPQAASNYVTVGSNKDDDDLEVVEKTANGDGGSAEKDVEEESDSFEDLSPMHEDGPTGSKGFREDLGEDFARSLLDHYERADLELSLPPPGRTGATRNAPVTKQKGDLEVAIAEYKKHVLAGSETFISYKITVKTSRMDLFDKEEYEVWRRYSDFEWLRKQLLKDHPSLIVPPLPGKQVAKFFNHMMPEFIHERQLALTTFLTRLAEHPILTFDTSFKIFLTVDSQELISEQVATINPGFWSELAGTVQKATTSFWLKNPDQEFVKHSKYVNSLSEKLSLLQRAENKLQEERAALAEASSEFTPVVSSWAKSEMLLETPLSHLASCNEGCCQAITQLNTDNILSFQHKVKEYQLYCATVQNALKSRDRLQLANETLKEEKAKKCKARDNAKVVAKEAKLVRLESDVETVSAQCEKALDELEKCNADLRMDLEHWHKQKDAEFCQMMTETADNHIKYHQQCFDNWEDVFRVLKDFKSTSTIETIDCPSSTSGSSVTTSEDGH